MPNGSGKTKTLTLGARAAAAIVALRQNDGTDVDHMSPNYTPGTQPGDYQFVPRMTRPRGGLPVREGVRTRIPRAVPVPAPPALTSRTCAKDYNEVKSVGAIDSKTRTTDQSNYANWWYEPPRSVGPESPASPQPAKSWSSGALPGCSRLFTWPATTVMSRVGDSKYHWDFCRHYSAIRAGDTDGNHRTVKDETWETYLETPPVQDYPSTHSTLGAGAAEVLKRSSGPIMCRS